MKRIAIIGFGDLGQQLARLARKLSYTVVGFYDDFALENEGVLGKTDEIQKDYDSGNFDELIVGVGYQHMGFRRSIFEKYKGEIPFANLIHPNAIVEDDVELGEGVVLYTAAVIDSGCEIGDNVLLNAGATIAHDTIVGDHSFLSPRAALAGFITVGHSSVLGINCTVIDNLELCPETRLSGGAVLIHKTMTPGLYAGVPAEFKKS